MAAVELYSLDSNILDIGRAHISPRERLLKRLRGQTLIIPDLWKYFPGWPTGTNSELEANRKHADEYVAKLYSADERRLRTIDKMKAADLGLFGASWWPETSVERLAVLTDLSIWLFSWNDELDSSGNGYAGDASAAERYRSNTLNFIRQCLELESSEPFEKPLHPVIESFRPIGEALRDAYTTEQRQFWLDQIVIFSQRDDEEQRFVFSDQIPQLEDYLNFLMGTSGMDLRCAMLEYSHGHYLPIEVFESQPMQDLWIATNGIISIVNDVLSLKRGLKDGAVHNVLPILFAETGNLESAVTDTMDMLTQFTEAFEQAAQELEDAYRDDPTMASTVRDRIRGCRFYCTGNLTWSLSTARYGVTPEENGQIVVQL